MGGRLEATHELIALAMQAQHLVAFTGAGISTESGIPDYRGPGGIWERNAPPTIGDFRTNAVTRSEYWRERKERYHALRDTAPNAGHLALTRLFEAGLLTHVITQNIDGLHQKAGMPDDRVIELHGSAHRVRCLDCGTTWPADEIQRRLDEEPLPECTVCGGMLRGATVLFGESLPEIALKKAVELSRSCNMMLVVGSSLVVQPAARLPQIAVASGASLAIVNNDATPLDAIANIVVRGSAGNALSTLADAVVSAHAVTQAAGTP